VPAFRELAALLARYCPQSAAAENVGIPAITVEGRPWKTTSTGSAGTRAEAAALKVIRMCGGAEAVQALERSWDEGVDDWETLRREWLPPRRCWAQPLPHYQRFCPTPAAVPSLPLVLNPVDGTPLGADPPPRRVRFAPSASGYLHVGNLRTLWAARALADSSRPNS